MSLIGVMLLLLSLAFLNIMFSIVGVKGFLSRYSSISSSKSLEDFKQMVRRQMYQALLQIILLGAVFILGSYGIISRKLSSMELLLLIILYGFLVVIGRICSGIEKQARSLPVSNGTLASEYKAICQSWVKKTLPNF